MTPQSALEAYFAKFRENIIGYRQTFESPFGEQEIIYTDWTATGRAYQPIEHHLQNEILPFVGNTHTEATVTGTLMSKAYDEAKNIIKQHVNADKNDVLLFCGSGMTAAVNKLQRLLGLRVPERICDYMQNGIQIAEELQPVVFITHMEHNSNYITWLETIATVEIIEPDESGNVSLKHFRHLLDQYKHRKNKMAAVTACSNVTGIETPYHEIAQIIHEHKGLCFVDFATSAPYVDINMHPAGNGNHLDAIYFSTHKFLGGTGTPGVLVFNKEIYRNTVPDQPGGGTVSYTNPWKEREYISDIEHREDGGTPPFLPAIKAAMCIRLKEEMGIANIRRREEEILRLMFERFDRIENITVLQRSNKKRLGIISFIVKGAHYNLVVKILNDLFGVQARGGCSCAGTYGHWLLGVDQIGSNKILDSIRSGDLSCKPGWVRLSIHPTMTDAEIDFIMDAIETTVLNIENWQNDYSYDRRSGEYVFRKTTGNNLSRVKDWFNASKWSVNAHYLTEI